MSKCRWIRNVVCFKCSVVLGAGRDQLNVSFHIILTMVLTIIVMVLAQPRFLIFRVIIVIKPKHERGIDWLNQGFFLSF